MKWFKRLLLLICIALVAVVAIAGVGFYKYKATPKWYHPHLLTQQQRDDAQSNAYQKLAEIRSWAAAIAAGETVRRRGGKPSPTPPGPKTIALTDDELNSLVSNWNSPGQDHAREQFNKYFSDGRLIVDDGKLILVGDSKQFGSLTSASFIPWVDEKGDLWLKLDGFAAGTLPIPQSMMSDQLNQLQSALQTKIDGFQDQANIDSSGIANAPAAQSEMTRLLLDTLQNKPSRSVLFIPFDNEKTDRLLPVAVSAVKADENTLTLTLSPMSIPDRIALLDKIKHFSDSSASAGQ